MGIFFNSYVSLLEDKPEIILLTIVILSNIFWMNLECYRKMSDNINQHMAIRALEIHKWICRSNRRSL